ncbi:MAG: hypothetical protein GXY07_14275 [Candidatus Hydrogenedentes bacterium]|nr:hypothetical protein [Candidatus Hydrogenedentota bacterium]
MSSEKWNACDVLHGILSKMNGPKIPASIPILHNAFHALAQETQFHPFFDDYLFQKRIGFFFSEKMQDYLENMEMAKLLSCGNPAFETYEIKDKLKKSFDEYVRQNFSEQENELLGRAAEEFANKISKEHAA